jgi:hypothetical protein
MSKYQLMIIRLYVEIIRVVTVCSSAANDAVITTAKITNIPVIIVLLKIVGAVKLVTKIYCLPVFVKTDRLRPHS